MIVPVIHAFSGADRLPRQKIHFAWDTGIGILSVTSAHFKNKRRTFQIEVKNERKINGCS